MEEAKAPAAEIAGGGEVFVLSRKPNASYAVVNEVLKQGGSVAMTKDAIATPEGKERGAFVIRGVGRGAMDGVAKKYGVSVGAIGASRGM